MEWALAVGIIQGQNNQGIIDPQGESGRAVGATIFMRFLLNFRSNDIGYYTRQYHFESLFYYK